MGEKHEKPFLENRQEEEECDDSSLQKVMCPVNGQKQQRPQIHFLHVPTEHDTESITSAIPIRNGFGMG